MRRHYTSRLKGNIQEDIRDRNKLVKEETPFGAKQRCIGKGNEEEMGRCL